MQVREERWICGIDLPILRAVVARDRSRYEAGKIFSSASALSDWVRSSVEFSKLLEHAPALSGGSSRWDRMRPMWCLLRHAFTLASSLWNERSRLTNSHGDSRVGRCRFHREFGSSYAGGARLSHAAAAGRITISNSSRTLILVEARKASVAMSGDTAAMSRRATPGLSLPFCRRRLPEGRLG